MSEQKIEPPKEDREEKALAHFVNEYSNLCKIHGYMIAGELVYGSNGIAIKPVVIKRPKDKENEG